jgi:hypothetical protein
MLKYMPFAGIKGAQEKAIGSVEKDAGDVYNKFLGNVNEADEVAARQEAGEAIKKHGWDNYKSLQPEYKALEEEADKAGIKINKSNASEYAKKMLEEQDKSIVKPLTGSALDIAKRMARTSEKGIEDLIPKEHLSLLSDNQKKMYMDAYKKSEPGGVPEYDSLSRARSDISAMRSEASSLSGKGEHKEAKFYREMANAYDKDVEESLEKSGNKSIYDKSKYLSQQYKQKVVPFILADEKGMNDLVNGKIDYSTNKLEKIVSNTKNEQAISQLPQDTKDKLFARLLNNNIDADLKTRSQKLASAYKKLNDYERKLIPQKARDQFEKLAKRVDVLKPILEKSSKAWDTMHKLKYAGYLAGASILGMVHGAPLLVTPGVGTIAARTLGSKKLMNAYMGKGPVLGENMAKKSGPIARGLTTSLGSYVNQPMELDINKKSNN